MWSIRRRLPSKVASKSKRARSLRRGLFLEPLEDRRLLSVDLVSSGPALPSPPGNSAVLASTALELAHGDIVGAQSGMANPSTATSLSATADSWTFGQSMTFMATVAAVDPEAGTPTGTVTFYDIPSGLLGSSSLEYGYARFETSSLAVGSHSITAFYESDGNFLPSNAEISQTVDRGVTTTTLTDSASSIHYGQLVTFTVTVSADAGAVVPTGQVTLTDDNSGDVLATVMLDANGRATFSTSSLTADGTITARYEGDTNFSPSDDYLWVDIDMATITSITTSDDSLVGEQSVTFTVTVSAVDAGVGTPTGSVCIEDSLNDWSDEVPLDASGHATVSTRDLTPGNHTITVTYYGDDNFDESHTSLTETVTMATTTTTLVASQNPVGEWDSVTFTATVSGNESGAGMPTGRVYFEDSDSSWWDWAELDANGQATVSTDELGRGTHTIFAYYDGTANSSESQDSVTERVVHATTIDLLRPSDNPSEVGHPVYFDVEVKTDRGTPTGRVMLLDGNTVVDTQWLDGDGYASLTAYDLTLGSHTITVSYEGEDEFAASSESVTQIVGQASAISVSTLTDPSVVGQSVSFTATINGLVPGDIMPTGMVTFRESTTILGTATLDTNGHATFSTSTLGAGRHTIRAYYGGDANFAVSASPNFYQTVNRETTTALTASAEPAVFGQSIMFTATVSVVAPGTGVPGGAVVFREGTTILSTDTLDYNGRAAFITSAFSVGSHTITATYEGFDYCSASSTALTETVARAETITALGISAKSTNPGQSVTLTATVAAAAPGAGQPGGIVTFLDGTTVLGTGTIDPNRRATFSTSTLTVGSHTLTASYGGNADFVASTSASLTGFIATGVATAKVYSSHSTTVYGQSVTFTAMLRGKSPKTIPTGIVTFVDGSTTLGTRTLDATGNATWTTSALNVASHTITAFYSGDANFGSVSSTVIQKVSRCATTTTVTASAVTSVFGQSVTFTATVGAKAPGDGTPGGTVTFYDGHTVLGTCTLDGNRQATITTSALIGANHPIKADYSGDTSFVKGYGTWKQKVAPATTTTVIVPSMTSSVFGQSITLTATVSVTGLGAGTPTGTVTFVDGRTKLGYGTLNASGQFVLSTSALLAGNHTITAQYKATKNFAASTGTLTQLVAKATTSTAVTATPSPSTVGTSVTVTATIGVNAPGAGVPTGKVTFMDGSIILRTVSLSHGKAIWKPTNWIVASHTITAIYVGDANFATSTGSMTHEVTSVAPLAFSRAVSAPKAKQAETPSDVYDAALLSLLG